VNDIEQRKRLFRQRREADDGEPRRCRGDPQHGPHLPALAQAPIGEDRHRRQSTHRVFVRQVIR
jgi:hypothetical protein